VTTNLPTPLALRACDYGELAHLLWICASKARQYARQGERDEALKELTALMQFDPAELPAKLVAMIQSTVTTVTEVLGIEPRREIRQ